MGAQVMLNVRNKHAADRERLVANGIREVVAELRLVEAIDYVAFLRMEAYGNIADIVDSSTQLFLQPGALRFADGGEIHLTWGTPPAIDLDMELRLPEVSVHFRLSLSATRSNVHINYIAFAEPDLEPGINTQRLAKAIEAARLRVEPRV
ncbi:hypothetical protein [Aureimonas ureilytica]|uniref:hypothetical protein n=1 Tax=Aureimonas ureilytica TaxID=401562 RepID=UPI0003810839|nr:hypothetical protein [Aureimonas ureilytica]